MKQFIGLAHVLQMLTTLLKHSFLVGTQFARSWNLHFMAFGSSAAGRYFSQFQHAAQIVHISQAKQHNM